MKRRALELVFILFAFSCDDVEGEADTAPPKSICQQMYDRISVCVGGRVPYDGGGCDEDLARRLVNLECDPLLAEIR